LPFQDPELDRLARDRDQAKRALDEARYELDKARSNRDMIQSMYGPKLDYLKSAIPDTKVNMKAAFEQASSSWEAGHKSDAKDWSDRGKQLKAEQQGMYTEKEECIAQLKAAGETFRQALNAFQARKAEYETDSKTFFARIDYLKEESAKARAKREEERRNREEQRGWQPGGHKVAPDVGVIAGTNQIVSFKTNKDGSQVLIRDGDYGDHGTPESRKRAQEFNSEHTSGPHRGKGKHDHYGTDRRTSKRFEETRGYHDDTSYRNS